MVARWEHDGRIELLGSASAQRLPIASLRIRHGQRWLHHNFVVALLNDVFGVQARGGCSCAGPYGHRLLAIDAARSRAFEGEISRGCEGVKPGWVRLNLNYFISDTVADYLAEAVRLIAAGGYRLLGDYRFDPRTGLWRHHAAPVRAPVQLTDLRLTAIGGVAGPPPRPVVGEDALAGYLDAARLIMAEHPDVDPDPVAPSGMPADFETLRWFPLPAECLVDGADGPGGCPL